jgi:hypothetical protein
VYIVKRRKHYLSARKKHTLEDDKIVQGDGSFENSIMAENVEPYPQTVPSTTEIKNEQRKERDKARKSSPRFCLGSISQDTNYEEGCFKSFPTASLMESNDKDEVEAFFMMGHQAIT